MVHEPIASEQGARTWAPGDRIVTGGRTVDMAAIAGFAALAANYDALHTDSVFMASSRFGSRIAHGSLTYSLASGLLSGAGYPAGDTGIEIRSIKASSPVHAGDTLNVVGRVLEVSDGGERILSAAFLVKNQRGDDVMSFAHVSR